MAKTTVTAKQFRSDMKQLGYNVRFKTGTLFSTATITKGDEKVNGGNVFTQAHLDAHQAFYDYAKTHSIVDNGWRTII